MIVSRSSPPTTVSSADPGALATGASWRYAAMKKGRFDYICTLHPTMKATLVVE